MARQKSKLKRTELRERMKKNLYRELSRLAVEKKAAEEGEEKNDKVTIYDLRVMSVARQLKRLEHN